MGFTRRTLLMTALALCTLGCQAGHEAPCADLYDRLLTVGGASPEPTRRARFMAACETTWDEGRHRCMMRSKTVTETLECRPSRVRPD
jgi:hypothetical protein